MSRAPRPHLLAPAWAAEEAQKVQTIGESLCNYGWGDGGGGPDPEMLEYMQRYQAFPGITPDNGLSLLNDCTYGHEAFDGMMALTLLRGPRNPDPQSDQEEHRFTYAL